MSAARINELLAISWPELASTFAHQADTSVGCLEWKIDNGRSFTYQGIGVSYRFEMHLDAADFFSSIGSPPGYARLSNDHLVAAIPLDGTWTAGIMTIFKARFRAWSNPGGQLLDTGGYIPQLAEIYGFRATADVKLNVEEAARPLLDKAKISARLGLGIEGLLNFGMTPTTLSAEYDSPDTFRLLVPLDVPLITPPLGISHMPKVGFVGNLELTLTPQLQIGYVGALRIRFFQGSIPGTGLSVKIEDSIPFSFRINLKVGGPKILRSLLASVQVPKDWGEHPPAILRQTPAPPAVFDFLTPALQVEESVLPNAAIDAPDDFSNGPYHAPYGLIYEIRWFCDGPPKYQRGRHRPVKPLYQTFHDTALWTGHFLAAESFRYAVTQSEDDLARVRFILEGIHKLFEVTGVVGLPARSALKSSSKFDTDPSLGSFPVQTAGTPCHPGRMEEYYRTNIKGEDWWGFGRGEFPPSRDSYIGLMMGMTYAHVLVEDAAVRSRIKELVTAALHNLVVLHRWNVHTPGTPSQPIKTTFIHQFCTQLALLRLGKTVNPQAFGALYDHFSDAADFSWIPEWGGTWDPIAKYYGFNLSHGVMGILLMLEDDELLRSQYKFGFAMIRRATRHHRNAYFNMVRVMSERVADRQTAIDEPAGFAPQMTLGAETRLLLEEWLIRRRCSGGPLGLPTERSPDPEFLLNLCKPHSPNPAVPYTPVGEQHPGDALVSSYALPVHKRPGWDFLWQRSPFATDIYDCPGGPIVSAARPELEATGIDYLLPFWMAAYLKIVPGQ